MALRRLCCCIPFLSSDTDEEAAGLLSQPPHFVEGSAGEKVDGVRQGVEESAGEKEDGVPQYVEESAGEKEDGVPQCVKESAGEKVDGVPQGVDAPSSSGTIEKIVNEDIPAGDLEKLVQHISDLLSLREQVDLKKPLQKKSWTWPSGSDWNHLNEMLSSGLEFISDLKDVISGPVKTILKGIGNASLATAGLLVVAYTLERFDDISNNNEECFELLKEMSNVAKLVKILKENPKEMENEIEDATATIVKGAIMCCAQINSSPWKRFLEASKNKEDLSDITGELLLLYSKIGAHGGLRAANDIGRVLTVAERAANASESVLTAIKRNSKSPLSRKYPTYAVGIEDSVKEVLHLLDLDCKSDQKNAVTVILHGFGGMGKSTLADAVFSQIEGYEYSKIQLFKSIGSNPDIEQLQKEIIKQLMGDEEPTPNFITYQDGQAELGEMLKKVQAFIYIDNVLDGDALKMLLPPDMDTAMKVRFLITARNENVKNSCPRSRTEIYRMKGIQPPQAKCILETEIHEGINDSQFSDIIEICGGIPLMLTIAAPFIGRAPNKENAYNTLKRQKGKWASGEFKAMHYAFAYDALPRECKAPLHDICSFFKGWEWETVADIVGEDELERLQSRALVTKTTNGVASVHDVILTLSSEISLEESKGKEVRRTFTSASKLQDFLQDREETQGMKGIWLIDYKDILDISASTLDSMCNSLRILQLGDSRIKLEGNCTKTFSELIFLKAKITSLPFSVPTKLPQLRYLNYEPNDLKLSKMPPSLTHVDFIGTSHTQAFQIVPRDLQRLGNLRVLKLTRFKEMQNLPQSISELQFLRKLEMDDCSRLRELPPNLGSLSSLQELNLRRCSELKTLPDSVEKLSSLTLLNLSRCQSLRSLPPGLGKLTRLVELDLNHCILESIPKSISELKQLRTLDMSYCWPFKVLPHLSNQSSITHLSLTGCTNLEKLPDGFGQLANLRVLELGSCELIKKLPQGFGQLKSLEDLVLQYCLSLEELCDDFHCLSSLQSLDLTYCSRLKKLPEGFSGLASMQHLNLSSCRLAGKWMDHIVNMNRLQVLNIRGSTYLVKRWREMQRDGDQSWTFTVFSGQDLPIPEGEKENIENRLLAQFDGLLTNGQGNPFHLSSLLPDNLIFLICDATISWFDSNRFPWPLIEETMDDIRIIYIGPCFDELPAKVKDTIFVGRLRKAQVRRVVQTMYSTLDRHEGGYTYGFSYFQMRTKMVGGGKSDKYRPCWTSIGSDSELEEFLLGNSGRYLRLKEIVESSESSNIKLLRELFAPEADETTPVFQKNHQSKQDHTENSEPLICSGVDKLKGKTIIFELRPVDSSLDTRLGLWKEMYAGEKEKLNVEIITIPIGTSIMETGVLDKFSREVPWLVLRNSGTVITRAVRFFLVKHCGWEWGSPYDDPATFCSSLIRIIKPNGEIFNYELDHLNSFQSVSYEVVRWRIKGCPLMHEAIEELRKKAWQELRNMSMLEFLFNYLKNVLDEVKRLMFQGKMICLYKGKDKEDTHSIWNAMEDLRYDIHIIHIGDNQKEEFKVTDILYKYYYYSFQKTIETEDAPLWNLPGHEAAGFWMRLLHLKKEIEGMDSSDTQLCELKTLLDSFELQDRCMTFMDKDGIMIAACKGKIMKWIFEDNRKDRANRLIKKMMKELEAGKETHDEDSSVSDGLTKNLQTSAAAVKQENVDVDFDSLSEYISELLTVKQLHHLLKFNKGKMWPRPKVARPTSTDFCMLNNFLSEGENVNWVKDGISCLTEQEESMYLIPKKVKAITEKLVEGIGEVHWAVAGLLVVAHVLERFETVSANPKVDEWLLVLDDMFRMAQYINQFNQTPGLWTKIKREATGWIVAYSIFLCTELDPGKFSMFVNQPMGRWRRRRRSGWGSGREWWRWRWPPRRDFKRMCDFMTNAVGKDPASENALLCKRSRPWRPLVFVDAEADGESENEDTSSSEDGEAEGESENEYTSFFKNAVEAEAESENEDTSSSEDGEAEAESENEYTSFFKNAGEAESENDDGPSCEDEIGPSSPNASPLATGEEEYITSSQSVAS